MRAARYYGKEDIRVEDVDEDLCGEGQVRVCFAFVFLTDSPIVQNLFILPFHFYPFQHSPLSM
jgi:hypothetical protein